MDATIKIKYFLYYYVKKMISVCVLAVYDKAQAQRISNREFKVRTFLQGTESRVATFLAETCVMSHQSLRRNCLWTWNVLYKHFKIIKVCLI